MKSLSVMENLKVLLNSFDINYLTLICCKLIFFSHPECFVYHRGNAHNINLAILLVQYVQVFAVSSVLHPRPEIFVLSNVHINLANLLVKYVQVFAVSSVLYPRLEIFVKSNVLLSDTEMESNELDWNELL